MFCASKALFMSSEGLALRRMRLANAGVAMTPAALYHFTVVAMRAETGHLRGIGLAWAISTVFLGVTLLSNVLFDGFYQLLGHLPEVPVALLPVHGIFLRDVGRTLKLYRVEYRRSDTRIPRGIAGQRRSSMSAECIPPLSRATGDRGRFVQVITNILSNAVKFTPEGGAIHMVVRQERVPEVQRVVEISEQRHRDPGCAYRPHFR